MTEQAMPHALKAGRLIFLLVLLAYWAFPNEDGIREWGIGSEGGRVLLLDLFVITLLFLVMSQYRTAVSSVVRMTSRVGWVMFWSALLLSMVRGLPLYGGWAIGESRWFFCSILVPVGYLLFDDVTSHRLKTVLIVLGVFYSVLVTYQVASGAAWDVSESVMRFAGGRAGLIVSLGILVLLHDIMSTSRIAVVPIWKPILSLYFAGVLLVIQTRSLYVFLPIVVLVYSFVTSRVNSRIALKILVLAISAGILLYGAAQILLPKAVTHSIDESISVVWDGFSMRTLEIMGDPSESGYDVANQFSKSGNTAFRLMAWSQVIAAIDETPWGWLLGMPMGAGFYFIDPSGHAYENLEPHNDYLAILSKVGFVGLIGYFMVLASFAIRVFRHSKTFPSSGCQNDSALLLAVVLLLSLFGSLNAEMRTYATHFWLWMFLGLGIRSLESREGGSVASSGSALVEP